MWRRLRTVLDPLTAHNFAIDAGAIGLFAIFQALTSPFIAVVVVRRGAVPWEVGVLAAAPSAAMLLSGWYARLAQGRRLVPIVVWTTAAARILLLVMAWARGLPTYIVSYTAFCLVTAVSNPAYSAIEAGIYREPWRGRLMAGVRTVLGFFQFAAMLVAGRLLQHFGHARVWTVAVVFGLLSSALFSRMREPATAPAPAQPRRAVGALGLVRADPRFRALIVAVMLAGGGNLLVQPGYPIYQVHRLHLGDGAVALLSAAWALAWTLFYPLWGRVCDQRRPAHAIAISFGCYVVVPLCYALGAPLPVLLGASVVQGIGDSALDAGWQNHVMRLAGERTRVYAGAYYTFLGIRGTLAPILGGLIAARFGLVPLFVAGAVATAAGLWTARRLPDGPLEDRNLALGGGAAGVAGVAAPGG